MSLHLFNTLTGKKEEFKPIDPSGKEVRMYNCGPTVYNYAHIGNLRAYVFVDVLRRTLEYNGYKVKQVMNITDVGHLTSDGDDGDDKMVKALKREGKPFTLEAMREVADFYAKAFKNDLTALNIKIPEILERASDHIPEDIELIKTLKEKGFAYKTSNGMYFDTSKFSSYGKLGKINLEGQKAGARVAVNSEKKNPADFTLWKISANDIGWGSPWGKGFPGWHIECSAMSKKYLGQPFDIHTGGVDHIPVHHNNEIAQSEAAYGVPLANVWMHNEHLIVADGPNSAQGSAGHSKMAKSGENFITLQTLKEKNIHPLSYRYYLLQTHYRSPLNFSWEALEGAETAYAKLLIKFSKIKKEADNSKNNEDETEEYLALTKSNLNNDLDTPTMLATLWSIFENQRFSAIAKIHTAREVDSVLGLDIERQAERLEKEAQAVPDSVKKLAEKREDARKAKNFKEADKLRKQIEKAGFEVNDTESGPLIWKKF